MSTASLTIKSSATAESDHETFRYMSGAYVFDVTRAIAFVQDGREPVELDEDDVRFSLKRVSINKKYLPKVDTSRPGIVAVVFAPDGRGGLVQGQRLIDGHHRAARCLKLGHPFYAYLLSDQESSEIVVKSPDRSVLEPFSPNGKT